MKKQCDFCGVEIDFELDDKQDDYEFQADICEKCKKKVLTFLKEHLFVEDDILAEKSLKGEFDELKTLKDITGRVRDTTIDVALIGDLKKLAISHIKYMRREGRDLYYANIDEKSAIPWIINFFNLTEEDVGKPKISKVERFL